MDQGRRQTIFIALIFSGAILACGVFGWLGFTFFSTQIDTAVLPTSAPTVTPSQGVAITSVAANSPGAIAGLQPGQIILEANGVPIDDTSTLQTLVAELPASSEINLIVLVNDERRQTTARRGEVPPYLGIEIVNRDDFVFELLSTPTPEPQPDVEPNVATGLPIVAEVVTGSPAEVAGLQAGDVITAVNGQAILNSDELVAQLLTYAPNETITLVFRRGEDTLTRSVTLGPNPDDAERPF
ncbi:MAG: PDZ domain-containing protein, partial [Chloroflexota bacterium]